MRFSRMALTGALMASAMVAAPAQAQIVSGHTRGCFGVGCVGMSGDVLQGLTFTGGTFSGTLDASGQVGIGGVGNNFGTLTLSSVPNFNYSGSSFTLFFDFTQPATSTGDPVFSTTSMSGNITQDGNGIVLFFNPNTASNGFATVTISTPIGVNAGDPAQAISGVIASPEPASMTLLATGLVGIFGAARRRRKNIAA